MITTVIVGIVCLIAGGTLGFFFAAMLKGGSIEPLPPPEPRTEEEIIEKDDRL